MMFNIFVLINNFQGDHMMKQILIIYDHEKKNKYKY